MSDRPFNQIPDHPFKTFLKSLAEDADCNPVPDIIEVATTSRVFLAFQSVNATARADRFRRAFDSWRPSASILSSHFKNDGAQIVIYLFNPNKLEQVTTPSTIVSVVVPDEPSAPAPGVTQMPYYK